MSDLISRRAAIDAINEYETNAPEYMQECDCKLIEAVKFDIVGLISELPSAVKHGKWELAEDGWYCSACELYPPFDCDPEEKGIPYCPYCGARMERSDDEAD